MKGDTKKIKIKMELLASDTGITVFPLFPVF